MWVCHCYLSVSAALNTVIAQSMVPAALTDYNFGGEMSLFLVCNEWVELPCNSEEAPGEELEEHTMVAHQVIGHWEFTGYEEQYYILECQFTYIFIDFNFLQYSSVPQKGHAIYTGAGHIIIIRISSKS